MNDMGNNDVKKEKFKIKIEDHPVFNPIGDIAVTTSNDLAKTINEVFVKVFSDYAGCGIYTMAVNNYGLLPNLKMYFHLYNAETYADKSKLFAFNPIDVANYNNDKNDIYSRVQRITSMGAPINKKVVITDVAKEAMNDYMMSEFMRNGQFTQWNAAYDVAPTNSGTFISLVRIDLGKFLSLIYGNRNENGERITYSVESKSRLRSGAPSNNLENWSLNIHRLYNNSLVEAAKTVGIGVQSEAGVPGMIVAR